MKEIDIKEISKFKHSVSNKVQFAEVDSFGVTHNIRYFYWLEWARIEYIRALGVKLNYNTFITTLPLMVVHSEIDYFNSSSFNDEYEVLTRTSFIKNSSLEHENIIRLKSGEILVKAKAVLVHLDAATRTPVRIPDVLRELIKNFEGDNVAIL